MQLSIIIVNYKTPELTLRCVERVVATISETKDYEIIIVDNHSEDNSEELIVGRFPQVIWINNPVNEGFGRANNLAIRRAKGDYLLLLNSDVEVLPGTIDKSLGYIQTNITIGVLGCKLLNEDGSEQKSLFAIASFRQLLNQNLFIDKFFRLKDKANYAIMGSFMLIPQRVMEEVEGFDPDFFMYSEELELCYRILKKGFIIEQWDVAKAIHAHGASSDSYWSTLQKVLSTGLLYFKVHGFMGYLAYHTIWFFNGLTNFFLMWWLDAVYRKSYFLEQKAYFANTFNYFTIPFLFNRNKGNGKRMLKRG